jgi:hypothetical protein
MPAYGTWENILQIKEAVTLHLLNESGEEEEGTESNR